MKQEQLTFTRPVKTYRIGNVKKILSMTHGTTIRTQSLLYVDSAIREFKIRTIHSSQTHRRTSLIKAQPKSQPQNLPKSDKTDLAGGFGLRRPTKLNPRTNLQSKNIPISSASKAVPKQDSMVSFEQIKLGPKVHSSQVCEVYSAIWQANRRFIIIKQYKTCLVNEELNRELKQLKNITHDNIVKYLGYTIKAGKKLAMLELVDGGSLSSFLSDYGPFNETLMRKYIRQLVEALIYLKGKHIIHGRIRCENILSDINGNVKLTLPRFKSYGVDDEHKSVYWSAPEVLYGEPTSQKSDVWSIGCTMVEMATGRNPWDGEAACITTFKRDLKQGRTPTIPNHLSLECRQIIDTCLKSDSTDRPTLELLKEAAFLKKF